MSLTKRRRKSGDIRLAMCQFDARYRHNQHLSLAIPLVIISLHLFVCQITCQPTVKVTGSLLVSPQTALNSNINIRQYNNLNSYRPHRSASDQVALVNHVANQHHQVESSEQHISLALQSLPLTRHQQQQVDLDNVIESTTLASIVGASANINNNNNNNNVMLAQPAALSSTSCQLPPTWAGRWYQANKEPIRVTNTEISDKGLCRDQKGDKFLFESSAVSSGNGGANKQPCLVCLVINERHLNVLQYKESSCQPVPANYYTNRTGTFNVVQSADDASGDDHSLLDSICSDITGDAQLESLFRLDTPAIECPISGQYSFSYDSCREPQSSLDSCIDKKQLNFKFAACPDVAGSESKSEVLKCYADWTEGNNYYMIGRLEHTSNNLDKGKFRCFVYEKSADGKLIHMAQSGEETCYGLINANEGPKTYRLAVKPPTIHKCQFPSYIQAQSENWLSVDNSLIYMLNQNSTKYQVKETKEGTVNEEATCLQQYTYPPQVHPHIVQHQQHTRSNQLQQQAINVNSRRYPQTDTTITATPPRSTANDVVYLVQITKNCHTTNYCVRFYKRSNGIVQIDYFNASSSSSIDGPCRNAFIEIPQTQIITSTNLERQRCPFDGAYTIEAPIESDLSYNPSNIFICPRQSYVTAQCDQLNRLRIHSRCSPQKNSVKNLYCLGRWQTHNGLVRLVLDDDDRQRYSAWYREYPTAQDSAADPVYAAGVAQQQQVAITTASSRSQQQLLTNSPSNGQYVIPIPHIVDMQITLLTPMPHPLKSMQVRLVKRSQCSELRGYANMQTASVAGSYPSSGSISTSSMQQSYTSSSATSQRSSLLLATQCLHNSVLILIVTLFLQLITRSVNIHTH